jgi:L-seryl-tRNA(Ser) seleniumtransferase
VKDSIVKGSDIVCFSTDKVLGGPQGGAIVGKRELVERCRRDPLARALRLGRLPLVALEATLACYLEGDLDAIPALAAVRAPTNIVRARAERICGELEGRGVAAGLVELHAAVGGGACAEDPLASWGVALTAASPERIAHRLRTRTPAVLSRVQEGTVLFDVRTLLEGEDELLVDAIEDAVKAPDA